MTRLLSSQVACINQPDSVPGVKAHKAHPYTNNLGSRSTLTLGLPTMSYHNLLIFQASNKIIETSFFYYENQKTQNQIKNTHAELITDKISPGYLKSGLTGTYFLCISSDFLLETDIFIK